MLRKLTVGLFALAVICLSLGCSGDTKKTEKKESGKQEGGGGGGGGGGDAALAEHEAVTKDMIVVLNEYAVVLESAKDKKSAEKAKDNLDDIDKRFKEVGERAKKLKDKEPTKEQQKALETKFKADLEAATKKMGEASMKLAKHPEAAKILAPAVPKIQKTMQESMPSPSK